MGISLGDIREGLEDSPEKLRSIAPSVKDAGPYDSAFYVSAAGGTATAGMAGLAAANGYNNAALGLAGVTALQFGAAALTRVPVYVRETSSDYSSSV